jgi:taurine dioxygenase
MSPVTASRLSCKPLKNFGAEVEGDLREPLTPAEQQQLRDLFWTHQVLVFRGQRLTHPQQIHVMEALGPVRSTPESVHHVSTDKTKGVLGTQELPFHSDFAFVAQPRPALSLQAVDVVDGGSSTRFVSGTLALSKLPAALRERVAGLRAVQAFPGGGYAKKLAYDDELPEWLPRHAHPVVMPHPATGRPLLYVNEMQTLRIEGLPAAEGQALLNELLACIYTPDNLYEHVWHNGDLVIWDNIATQHARGDVSHAHPRTLQKVQCGPSFAEQWAHYDSPLLQAAIAGMND